MTQPSGVKGVSQALSPQKSVSISGYPAVWLTLLGAFFRFAELGSVRLTHDLAWQGWEAARIINGVYPLIGQPSSVFLDNPPLMGYIQAIPLYFWQSPWSIFIFITLLNTLAIPFIYSAVEQTLGRRIALVSTLLFVINPWIVHFSRFTWTQGLLPFFLAVMFWGWVPSLCLHSQLKRSFNWPFMIGWIAFTAMCMSYVLAFAMLAPVGFLMLIFWKRLPKKELGFGILILVLAVALYGWAVSQNLDQNSGKFFDFLNRAGESTQVEETGQILNLTDDALTHALRFVTGRDFVGQDVNDPASDGPIPVPFLAQLARWGLSAAFLAGLISLLRKRDSTTWVLLIWFFAPIGMMMILPSSVFVHPHYLLFTLPAGGIIAAVGLVWGVEAASGKWKVASKIALLTFLVTIGGQFKASLRQSRIAVLKNQYVWGFDALPLSEAATLGRQMRFASNSATESKPIRAVSPTSDQILSAMSGDWFDSIGGLDSPSWTIISAAETVVYLTPLASRLPSSDADFSSPLAAAMFNNTERAPFGMDYFKSPLYASAVSLDKDLPPFSIEAPSEAGFTLLDFAIQELDSNQLEIKSYWRVDVLHDARNEWFVSPFAHLINNEGATVANEAPHGQWGHRWQVGDVYVSTVVIDVPEDAVKLGIGLFDPISGRTFLLNGPEGNVARFEADLP